MGGSLAQQRFHFGDVGEYPRPLLSILVAQRARLLD